MSHGSSVLCPCQPIKLLCSLQQRRGSTKPNAACRYALKFLRTSYAHFCEVVLSWTYLDYSRLHLPDFNSEPQDHLDALGCDMQLDAVGDRTWLRVTTQDQLSAEPLSGWHFKEILR